jgi:hypothetical protein
VVAVAETCSETAAASRKARRCLFWLSSGFGGKALIKYYFCRVGVLIFFPY